VLLHGFFHADPHPGNLLILPGLVVGFIDFGIMGRLDVPLRRDLTKVIRAIGQRDIEGLAHVTIDMTSPRGEVDLRSLTRDLGDLVDTYGDVPIGQLSMAEVLGDVLATAARHRLVFPPNLMLLIKAIVTIESVGRQLDPAFKIVEHAEPFADELTRREMTPRALLRRSRGAALDAALALRALPKQLETVGRKLRDGRLEVQFVHRNLDHFITEMDRSSNRLSIAVVIGALIIGSSFVIQAGSSGATPGYSTLGIAGFFIAGLLGLGLVVGVLRSGRL
jgi:ubiquinone biosynthesis protein